MSENSVFEFESKNTLRIKITSWIYQEVASLDLRITLKKTNMLQHSIMQT